MNETSPWEHTPGEDYWKALIEQGEMAEDPPAHDARPDAPPDGAGDGRGGLIPYEGAVAPDHAIGAPRGDCHDATWGRLERWWREGRTFSAPVIGCNKGGLLVRVCERIAFVPASQLADLPGTLGTEHLREDLESKVGRELALRLIELDRERNRVICSERATQWGEEDVDVLLSALEAQHGHTVEGTVRSLCDFGAFIDLGGVDGLIHISELSWRRVSHPSDLLEVSQPVRVMILKVDRAGRRVALSLKRLNADPWVVVGERYRVGDVIDVEITNVVSFGAFARVEEGVEGLVHISELSDGPFAHPRDVVRESQLLQARVLHVDIEGRRLGLSIRQA